MTIAESNKVHIKSVKRCCIDSLLSEKLLLIFNILVNDMGLTMPGLSTFLRVNKY